MKLTDKKVKINVAGSTRAVGLIAQFLEEDIPLELTFDTSRPAVEIALISPERSAFRPVSEDLPERIRIAPVRGGLHVSLPLCYDGPYRFHAAGRGECGRHFVQYCTGGGTAYLLDVYLNDQR